MADFRRILLTISLLTCLALVHAQDNNSLYFLKGTAQVSLLNPAFIPDNEFIVGIPLLSGVSVGFKNDFRIGDIITQGSGILSDTLKFDFNSFSKSVKNQSKYAFDAGILMFYAGLKSGKNFYSVEVSEKGYFRGEFDKSFVEYFEKGVAPYYGSDDDLGGLSFDLGQYREVGFGFSRQPDKKFSYGLRLKFLFGRMNLSSGSVAFNIRSEPGENLYLGSSGQVDIAGPLKYDVDTVQGTVKARRDLQTNDYYFNLSNSGLGMDAGFVYKTSNAFSFSASVNYSGIIRFSKKHFSLTAQNDLEYNADSLLNAHNPSDPRYLKGNQALLAFRDSIPYMVVATPGGKALWEYLPATIYLGADYRIDKRTSVGFVQKVFLAKRFSTYFATLGLTSEVTKGLTLSGTYSVMPQSYFNLGIGAVYKISAAQFVFASDNIFSLASPNRAKNLNLHFGINLLINRD